MILFIKLIMYVSNQITLVNIFLEHILFKSIVSVLIKQTIYCFYRQIMFPTFALTVNFIA